MLPFDGVQQILTIPAPAETTVKASQNKFGSSNGQLARSPVTTTTWLVLACVEPLSTSDLWLVLASQRRATGDGRPAG